jgi:hypothetical protein
MEATLTMPCGGVHESPNWYRRTDNVRDRYVDTREMHRRTRRYYVQHIADRRQRACLQALVRALTVPESAAIPSLEQRFHEQAEKWDRETAHLSSPLQRMSHPSYQSILGMGAEDKQSVVRFLLRDLKKNGRDWFLALSYLTQENPIDPKDSGQTEKLIRSWVRWGEERGLI